MRPGANPVPLCYDALRRGLVPHWAKDLKIGGRMINARAETVATMPAFRDAFAARRCLIPASGFYEWQKTGAAKQPYAIVPEGEPLFAFENWSRVDQDMHRHNRRADRVGGANP